MSTETKDQMIERIAWQSACKLTKELDVPFDPGEFTSAFVAALTALCEEMEREKQRSSLDRNSIEHKNCDSTCQECT